MDTIETRLSGRDANAKSITREINRCLGSTPLARVEVHYSNQSQEPFNAVEARSMIAALLRENGMYLTKVSVRPHDAMLDNATGAHLLCLFPTVRSTTHAQRNGLTAWLAKWFPGWFVALPAQAAKALPPATPPQTSVLPKIPDADAVAYLSKALDRAAAAFDKSDVQVSEARIIVRLQDLHAVLAPLLRTDIGTGSATKSMAGMLRKHGITAEPGLKVSYEYTPILDTECTTFASATDIEVRLLGVAGVHARIEPTLMPSRTDAAADADMGTAMPFRTFKPGSALTVRVLGTWQDGAVQPFAQVIEVSYATLPARFDRKTLEQAGFGKHHPKLLSLVSNTCPLRFQHGPNHAVCALSETRKDAQGQAIPMYYLRDTLAPLVDAYPLTQASTQLVVNDPSGVQDPVGGGGLPALVIELRLGTSPSF